MSSSHSPTTSAGAAGGVEMEELKLKEDGGNEIRTGGGDGDQKLSPGEHARCLDDSSGYVSNQFTEIENYLVRNMNRRPDLVQKALNQSAGDAANITKESVLEIVFQLEKEEASNIRKEELENKLDDVKKETEELKILTKCKICLDVDAKSRVVIRPCGHLLTCTGCCNKIMQGPEQQRKCPLCRAPIISTIIVNWTQQ